MTSQGTLTTIKPLGNRVLARRLASEEKIKGGIILPDSAKQKQETAEVIAIASGEDDVFEIVLGLPFPIQVDALTKIGKLTFASEDTAKKFLQTARSAIGMFSLSKNG